MRNFPWLSPIALTFLSMLLVHVPVCNAEEKPEPTPKAGVAKVHTNRLAGEKSPYLLQHAKNPVNWFPWGEEAFETARREKKPIFLSIGYSTCHWCHVMERESFENEEIAAYLNKHFISIKVDREERPDVDHLYMSFVQATTGSGGWPMTVFLTPDRKPFFGGTYFPPKGKQGSPGFTELLALIHGHWSTKHADVVASAEAVSKQIQTHLTQEPKTKPTLNPDLLRKAVESLAQDIDPVNGGFGHAPKFPSPSVPSLLLRYGARHNDMDLVNKIKLTGDRMAAGGIHDQLGGGFSRYSVDEKWLVPHFEKMLYDNAQLLDLYLDLYLVSGEKRFANIAHDISRYLLRDMTDPEGGFYSAEDADSEGYEGKFYTWTLADLTKLLSAKELAVAVRYFGITERGNFIDHSHPDPEPNQNVLSIVDPKLSAAETKLLDSAKAKMFAIQQKRIRPRRDDKILSSWNGLMLGPLARAGVILDEPLYRAAAEKNIAFIKAKLWDTKTQTLHHRWRDGERDTVQLLEAYAYLLNGVVTLYECTLDPQHLEFSIRLADSMIDRFYDSKDGGFWQSGSGAKDLIARVKQDDDGAQPSGNSVAIMALLKLSDITEQARFRESAEKSLRFFSNRIERSPYGAAFLCQALDYSLDESRRVVITGDPVNKDVQALIAATHSVYQPTKVVLGNRGQVEEFATTIKDSPQAEAYFCRGKTCQLPTHDPVKLKQMLTEPLKPVATEKTD